MNKQEIERAIERLESLKRYAQILKDPSEFFHHMNGHRTELSLVLASFDIAELSKEIQEILTHQLTNGWIPVSSGNLPKCEERVFICADRKCYGGKVMQIRTTGMYEDGTMHTEDSSYVWEDHDFEYCEETDDYIIPEGWFEQNMYCEEYGIIDDVVTHWMPLPKAPKEVSDAERN